MSSLAAIATMSTMLHPIQPGSANQRVVGSMPRGLYALQLGGSCHHYFQFSKHALRPATVIILHVGVEKGPDKQNRPHQQFPLVSTHEWPMRKRKEL
jgi:hypothetical protein